MSIRKRHIQSGALACLLLTALSAPAGAQFVVSDPTNLIQNTTSAVSEVQTTVQSIRAVVMQAEQLRNQIQNLAKLDIQNLADLQAAYYQITGIIDRTRRLAAQWKFIADNFDEIYGEYGPRDYQGDGFWSRRKTWEDNTDMAYRQNLDAQASVGASHAELYKQAQVLDGQSQSVQGEVAATELGTKTLGVIVNQNALLIELQLAQARADQAERLERRRKSEAAKKRLLDRMGRGFGQIESTADPVELEDF